MTTVGNRQARYVRELATGGALATVVTVVLVAILHVVPPSSELSPTRRTISHYALLPNGWVFDLAVLTLAGGSAAVLAALLAGGLLRPVSVGTAGLLLWCASLVAVVAFEKHDWSVGPTASGDIHRLASALTFLSLPVASLALARAYWRDPRWSRAARATLLGAALSVCCIAPVAWAIASQPYTGVTWWRAIPLGAVERAIALTEVAIVLGLACWAAATHQSTTHHRQ